MLKFTSSWTCVRSCDGNICWILTLIYRTWRVTRILRCVGLWLTLSHSVSGKLFHFVHLNWYVFHYFSPFTIFFFVFFNNVVVPVIPISSLSWGPSVISRERTLSWMNCKLYPAPISLTREDSTVPPGSRTGYLSTVDAWPCDRRTRANHKARDHAIPVTLTGIYTFWLYECMYI